MDINKLENRKKKAGMFFIPFIGPMSYLDRERISRVHHHGKIWRCVNDHIAVVVRQDGQWNDLDT